MSNNYIMGIHAIEEVLVHKNDRIIEVYVSSDEQNMQDRKKDLINNLKKNKIPLIKKGKKQISEIVSSDSHSGIVAKIKQREFFDIKGFIDKDTCCLVALDRIFDPHNLGAILRASECFGTDGAIISKNRGCPITAVVAKSSCGASELLPIIKISNLATTLRQLQKAGFFIIVPDLNEKAEDANHFSFPEKCVIVMGSEEKGVQPSIKKLADFFLTIPMHGKIDSLNVSQAAATLLCLWKRKY